MKNIIKKTLGATILSIFSLMSANAQTHDISLNLAPIAFSNYSGNYFFNLTDKTAVGGVIGYQNLEMTSTSSFSTTPLKYTYGGFYLAPEGRYYFNPSDANDGYFIGGYLKFRSMGTSGNALSGLDIDGTYKEYDSRNTGISLGLTSGRMFVTDFGLTISTWAGIGYYLYDKETFTNNFKPDPTFSLDTNLPSLDFRVGINVGYRIGM
ncbi:MAG: DUF3575 domain-containing protein [Bacteroidota bacterium]|nr:DUF3575 domain-containing protein [Bacteroidota bacterium]